MNRINQSLLNNKPLFLTFCLLLILAYFPLFLHLDAVPLRMWDESFYAVSALEMFLNHNFLVKYFNHFPDFYNLKPLLITWIHTLSFSIFGINELALRLPSALSGLFLIIVLFFFLKKLWNDTYSSFFACLILLTSKGFISDHVTRTGDLDAPLTLFLFLSAVHFFLYLTHPLHTKYLNLTFVFTFLAVMTKGVAGLLFLPGLIIASAFSGKLIRILKTPAFYYNSLIFVSLIIGYYLLIEKYQPGYISHVLDNEVFGRYLSVKDGHQHGFLYYFRLLSFPQFFPWLFLLPFSLLLSFKMIENRETNFFVYSWIISLSYLIIISFGKSKLEWYTAPIFPFLAILAVQPIDFVVKYLSKFQSFQTPVSKILLMVLLGFYPYQQIISQVYFPENNWEAQKYGTFFRQIKKHYPEIKKFTVIHDGWNSHLVFYVRLYNEIYGYHIRYVNTFEKPQILQEEINQVKSGDYIVAFQTEVLDPIYYKFNAAILDRYGYLVLVKLFSVKEHPRQISSPRKD